MGERENQGACYLQVPGKQNVLSFLILFLSSVSFSLCFRFALFGLSLSPFYSFPILQLFHSSGRRESPLKKMDSLFFFFSFSLLLLFLSFFLFLFIFPSFFFSHPLSSLPLLPSFLPPFFPHPICFAADVCVWSQNQESFLPFVAQ